MTPFSRGQPSCVHAAGRLLSDAEPFPPTSVAGAGRRFEPVDAVAADDPCAPSARPVERPHLARRNKGVIHYTQLQNEEV